jgi:S1-C subfamily serine protease
VNGALPLLEKVGIATVNIHSQIPQSHPSVAMGLGPDRRGTGTLVSADGLIVTVNYMVIGAESVMVTFTNGRQVPARVVARDFTTSLGVLQVEGNNHPYLEVTSSETASLGQDVLILSSLGGEKRCADTGLVTYLGPFDAAWEFVLDRCVCASAPAHIIGLSGGPILNSKGQILAFSYLNFNDVMRPILAIPGECFLSGRDELVRHGRRVSTPPKLWLGVFSYTLREHVVIAGVMPGSPGEKAGLQQGDLVLSADGNEIHERRALYEIINSHRPGESVHLRILRKNQVYNLAIAAIVVDEYLG